MSNEKMIVERDKKAVGSKCANAKYTWHRVDGYCKECRVYTETDAQVRERRNARGYR